MTGTGMSATEVHRVLDALAAAGCRAWVGGGWGVDALVGSQTRPHRDLDLAVDATGEAAALGALQAQGYAVETDRRPVRVELAAPGRRWVDLHPVRFDAGGDGTQAGPDGAVFPYPSSCFVRGSIDGRPVGCLSVDQQLAFHSGYVPRDVDLADLALLRRLQAGGCVRRPLVLTGAPAAGKSATGRWLAEQRPRAAHIDVDDVRQLVVAGAEPPWRGTEGAAQCLLGVANACALASSFTTAGFDVVLADVLTPATAAVYRELLPGCLLVRLAVDLVEARRRATTRPVWLSDEEFTALHDADRIEPPPVDVTVDVTAMTLIEQRTEVEVVWVSRLVFAVSMQAPEGLR